RRYASDRAHHGRRSRAGETARPGAGRAQTGGLREPHRRHRVHLSVARRRHRATGNPAAREDDRLSALSLAGMAAAVPSLRSARNYGSRSDLRIGALSALADRGDGAERGTSMKPPCGVITLTTDFGVQDSYVG